MSDLGRPAEYRVYGLLDASTGQLAYIGADRQGKPRWPAIYEHRDVLSGELARFMRSQSQRPAEVVLVGSSVGLPAKVARAAADILRGLLPRVDPGTKNGRSAAARSSDRKERGNTMLAKPIRVRPSLEHHEMGGLQEDQVGTLLDLGPP